MSNSSQSVQVCIYLMDGYKDILNLPLGTLKLVYKWVEESPWGLFVLVAVVSILYFEISYSTKIFRFRIYNLNNSHFKLQFSVISNETLVRELCIHCFCSFLHMYYFVSIKD